MKIQSIALAMTLTTFFDSPGMALPFTGNVTDSVHVLNAIPIISERISNFSASNKIQTIDSISIQNYQWNNLGELLNDQSQVVVKTYGPGLTATTSFRGSDAEQTAVLWNGFNINSPMLAQLDFGLIPVDFLQEVKVQYGGASALFGSGAVGGIIHLDNTAQYSQGLMLSANTSYGSFNANQNGLSASLSTSNYIFSVKAFDRTATNNFPFLDIAKVGTPIEYQTNSQLRQWGLLQENYFKLNPYQEITVRLWYQNSDRHIPPSMTTQDTTASEKDNFLRITSEFKRSTKNQTLSVRAAFFDEQLNYFDPAVNLSSYSSAKTLIAEIEDKMNKHLIDNSKKAYNWSMLTDEEKRIKEQKV